MAFTPMCKHEIYEVLLLDGGFMLWENGVFDVAFRVPSRAAEISVGFIAIPLTGRSRQ